jgi:hypothetical protein
MKNLRITASPYCFLSIPVMPEISGWPWPFVWISEWLTPALSGGKKRSGLMAQKLMQTLVKAKFDRYPESFVFDFAPNPTSYRNLDMGPLHTHCIIGSELNI